MDMCMIPEVVTGERRKVLDAELDDVQELKRRRYNDGQTRRMCVRKPERRSPSWLEGYLVNAAIEANRESLVEIPMWKEKEVKIPKSFSEAMQTPQKVDWYAGMEKEVKAMFRKKMLVPIGAAEAPENAINWA
uniref:Uncharacterized protein n=1 Tax=Hyaloperonospora arabidopsidis (strain Emoy2) TaxID=559515 RepID=M4BA72_HYAAE